MKLKLEAWTISDTVAATALLILAPSCAFILLALPRAVAPTSLPGLRLDARKMAEVLKADIAATQTVPTSALAAELQELLLEEGRFERSPWGSFNTYQQLNNKLRSAQERLRRSEGEKAVTAARVRAVAQLEAALDVALPKPQAEAILGSFPAFLQRYRAAKQGELIAPPFVVRVMYKGRWNVLHQLPPTDGFAPVERLAHFGWLALHADGSPLPLRLQGVEGYAAAGGSRASEAKGVLYFLDGQYPQAARHLQTAYRQHRTLRLRNYLLGAQKAAGI